MRRMLNLITGLLALLLVAACTDFVETDAVREEGGIHIRVSIDEGSENQQTRTELSGVEADNQVSRMMIYIYRGTGDDAVYVAHEQVNWSLGANIGSCTLHTSLLPGEQYTLLGVGMDTESQATYRIDVSDATTLGNTYATLQEGKGAADIAKSEFFTGTVSFISNGEETEVEDLVLKRRVSGVMLYVKDIPQRLTVEGTSYRTTDIYLKLGQNQKSSVRLPRDFTAENWVEPNGQTELEESKTLVTLDLTKYEYFSAQDCYTIPSCDGLLTNTSYEGVYLLPMNITTGSTFTVEIWGVENADGAGVTDGKERKPLKTFTVENKSEETNKTCYSIRSNYLYCIGKNFAGTDEDEPISLLGEKLLLEVMPWESVEQNVTFEPARVQATFNPDFDEEKYRFNCINNEFTVEILPSMSGDQWEISIPLSYTCLDNNGNQTTVTSTDDYWLYITNKDGDAVKYYKPTSEECKTTQTVTFLMLDYAKQRDWGWNTSTYQWIGGTVAGNNENASAVSLINNDVRTIQVELKTTSASGIVRYDNLSISQYNTITVNYQNDDGYAVCGFSRVDVGDQFNKQGRDVTEPDLAYRQVNNPVDGGKTTNWGYDSGLLNEATNIYGASSDWVNGNPENGAVNMKNIGEYYLEDTWTEKWNGSAMKKSQHTFVTVSNGSISRISATTSKATRTDECWYLPSMVELEGLMKAYAGSNLELNVNFNNYNDRYWSSNIDRYKTAYAYYVGKDTGYGTGYVSNSAKIARESGKDGSEKPYSEYYIRQARKFADYYSSN